MMRRMPPSANVSGRGSGAQAGATVVLVTLAAGQFLMTLDTSVMNVAIATVAEDVGTDVTGIQTAITLYTLVMATLMITGGKVGALVGRKRAFAIGCVIYGAGSFTTSIAPSLPILLIGWSLLEGVGAALILPAIVALVAANFRPEGRPRAYGLVMAAGAIAVAVGPLIGGLFTTYLSWRLVFAGEVLIVIGILVLTRRIQDEPPGQRPRIDLVGVVLSAAGLGLAVFGVLRSSVWGWVAPKPDAPDLWGISATLWLILGGFFLVWLFFAWESRLEERGAEPLVRPSMLQNVQMVGGLRMFFFQYFVQSGVFFVVPLFLSVSLGLSAIDTGVRLLPLSVTLLIAAAGIPRFRPDANPRRVVRLALLAMFAGTVVLLAAIDEDASAEIITLPLLLLGLGIGALASQLGAVTVSAVPDELSPEVGGLQNTATNIGASLGTALAGSVLIASLTATLVAGIQQNPAVPQEVKQKADVELASGVPFLSDADAKSALADAGVTGETAAAIVDENAKARLRALRTALAVIAIVAAAALFFAGTIPPRQPGSQKADAERGPPDLDHAPA
jgi:MFS family permease